MLNLVVRKVIARLLKVKIQNIRDLYRGINDFKKGYQPRNKIVKDEKGDLITGCTVF